MLKIRLQRVGRVHEPSYRLVVTDSKNATKSGKYLEILGNFDARHGEASNFKSDRINHWIKQGAGVTDTVHNLLVSKKIITGKKINTLPLKKAIVKDAPVATEAPVETKAAEPVSVPVPEVAEESAPSTPEEVSAEVVA